MTLRIKLSDIATIPAILDTIDDTNYSIIEIRDFLSHAECDELVSYADNQYYQKSLVAGDIESSHRKSNQMWIYDGNNKIAEKISDLSHIITGLPIENMEPLQLLKYGPG